MSDDYNVAIPPEDHAPDEAERPADAPRDYPVLIDRVRAAARSLAERSEARDAGDDATLRAILEGLVDLGQLAERALHHWPRDEEEVTPEP